MVDLFDGIDFGDGSTTSTLDKSDDLFGGIDFTTSNLPAAAPSAVTSSPSAESAQPVDPVATAVSRGRNDLNRTPPSDIQTNISQQAAPTNLSGIIDSNNRILSSINNVLNAEPDLAGRNDTSRFNTLAPSVGQDGINPVSVFNPAPIDPTQAVQDQIVAGANAQLGPTQLKADLGLYEPDRSFGTAFESGKLRSRGQVAGFVADIEGRLKETGISSFLQSAQNASLPIINPIRQTIGLQPLPQDANRLASEASEAENRNRSERLLAQAQSLGFKPMTTDEIEGFGDFLTWAGSTIASSGEPMLVALASGGWMSPVLMAGEYNESLKEIEGLSEDKRLALATSGGILAGFLENIGLGLLVKGMPKQLVGALGGKYFADFIGKNYGTRTMNAVLSGMAAEGITEAGQEGIGITLESIAGKKFMEGERGKRLWEALAAGGVMGGTLRTGVQQATEVAGAFTPDPLLTETDKRQAQLAAISLQSSDNAQMTAVPETDLFAGIDLEPAPVSAAEPTVAPPTTEVAAVEPTPEPVVAPAVKSAEPAVEPTVEPTVEQPAPAAEPDNPQAKPVIPFARPVSDTDGQQKTLTIRTPNSEQEVKVKPFIIDLADLKQAEGQFQPRDRSLKESDVGVRTRAAKLDPRQLMESPITSMGAPIIARDGTIISGNGRVLSIELAKNEYPDQYANYKQAIEAYGTSDQNYETPVLVMMLDQDMSAQELSSFADISNREAIASMSTTEKAQRDAAAMGVETVNLYRGGDLTTAANAQFVAEFNKRVVTENERGEFSRDGKLTDSGVRRMKNSILATAYQDTDALAVMLDSTDNNVKNLINAMLEAAPKYAQLKAEIAKGEIKPEFDVSTKIAEALNYIDNLSKRGVTPAEQFGTVDAFAGQEGSLDPLLQSLVLAMYDEAGVKRETQNFMKDFLSFYVEEAGKRKVAQLVSDPTTPAQTVKAATKKARAKKEERSDEKKQQRLLPNAGGRGGRSLNESGQQAQPATSATSRQESGSQRSREATQARRQRQAELKNAATQQISTKVDDKETVGATENTVLPISELDSQRTQRPGTLVDREVMRKGSALQFQAFADAKAQGVINVEPGEAISLPIDRQFKILSDMMVKRFGFKAVIKTEEANSKEAVDQLLVGYHNLTNLAANIGLPTKAFGLEGTLSFVLAKNVGAYGVYDANTKAIALPKRSNSFAHEWFHALDHYLLNKYGSGLGTKIPLQTQAIRKHGTEAFGPDAPVTVKDSYFSLMRALFKEKASEAAQLQAINQKMAEIEARAARAGKAVSEIKTYQKLDEQKQNILAGVGKSKNVEKTQTRKDAEFFADLIRNGREYWTMPAEMAARSFEAFAITQVTNAGLQTEFLGMSREAYDMTLEALGVDKQYLKNNSSDVAKIMDSRLALTYPKEQDRVEIFGAYRNLMDAIARETPLGEGEAAREIGNEFVNDIRDMHNLPENETRGLIADQMREIRIYKNFKEQKKKEISQYKQMHSGKGFGIALPFYLVEDAVAAPLFFQKQGQLKSIMRRYPANRSLRIIFENLGTHTGGKFQPTREGGNLLEAQARQVRVFSDRFKNVINKHDVASFNELETKQLHMILTSQDTLGSAPDRVVKAAGDFRSIYNQMYDYLRNSGLDIGYAPSGYVQRVLDHDQIAANPQKFMDDAFKVYEIVFDEALGPLESDSLDYMLKTIQFIRDQKLGREVQSEIAKGNETLGKEPAYKDFIEGPVWTRITDARSQLRALQKAKKANPDSVKDEAIDAAQAELDEAVAAAADDFAYFHTAMRSAFAEFSAFNWRQNIQQSRMGTVTDASPQAIFSKKRKLPAKADEIMDQFYVNDPVNALTAYILAAVRKAEYSRRFGKHLLPDIANKTKYTDYLDYLLKKLENTETPSPITMMEAQQVKTSVDNILGRHLDDFIPSHLDKLNNYMAAALSLTLLVRAPIASIAEPMTTAMTTGSTLKGIHALGMTFQEFPGLRKLSKNAAEDIRLRHQFGRLLGIIDDPEVGDIITSRIGGEFAGDPGLTRLLSKFFAKIKLSGMTNAQRRTAGKVGFQFILEQAYEIRNPSSERNVARAKLVLKDLGVSQSNMEQFIDFVLDYSKTKRGIFGKEKVKTAALPEAVDIMDAEGNYTDMGLQLAVSVMRFVDQTIQDPRTADRPRWSEKGIGRIFYGIMSFIYSFQDKVLKAMGRKFKREYNISRDMGKGRTAAIGDAASWAAVNSAIPLLSLFAAHAVVSTAREYIFNQDRWDREWEENEEDPTKFAMDYLIPLAFARSGLTGAFDPVYQAFTGLKYQRDLSNYFLGTGGYIVQNVQDIVSAFTSANSPNTVSSEFKAYRGLYNLTIQPALSLALAMAPLTPAAALPATGGAMYMSSTTVKNEIINTITEFFHGQRYEPGQRGRAKKKRLGDK